MYVQSDGSNKEADVIVVGTGPGGLGAVGAAVEAGSEVIVVEANNRTGGNGTWSTGWIAFVDSAMQREKGLQDNEEIFLKDCRKLVKEHSHLYGIIWDDTLAQVFAKNSSKMYDILIAKGMRFTHLIPRPLQASVDRLHAIESTEMFSEAFESDFVGPRTLTYLNSRATGLIVEDGSVKGVHVQPTDGRPRFQARARKGVILATGGYQANPALRARHQLAESANALYPGLPTCVGDGHILGQAIGGDLINMGVIPPVIQVASALVQESIAVNAAGERFHDEAGPYYERVVALRKQPQLAAHYIFDADTFRSKRMYVNYFPQTPISADSLADLATKIGVPGHVLESSVRQWNDFMASGSPKDPLTGRVAFSEHRSQICKAPFYAAKMIAGISLTCGGFVTTTSMQVVDVFGNPIPGLFAVGDCAGGFTPSADMGGTHLGGGLVLGWEAGKAVSTGELAQPHTGSSFGVAIPSKIESEPRYRNPIIDVTASKL
ncbi:uncharacterized protein Z518_04588 [Rhinocladiella mackenziei CBS 650.93]|uniref:Rhinocladiella mackenziei CBS 650.93 unplaced genomic scaffold supercont1.3, whole genome shotgun sequence n=1 Tax=Rhinocladiella mackenziei CBS 650.93 TaxID=1442369 RepID=A0A0D2FWL3_9EURO|nr:uncharacterized protein Z518_04588 [Rhinocladiella mackenziei CBS 650.93]KIX06612.1 hypothetical protein Z518_04588 [Rhinocladiella mackenziei CBS 650.93]